MQSLRLTTPTLRSATRALSMRMYSTGSDAPAGSIARSKGWNTREKAQEDQYIIQHEKEKLEKLRESMHKQQKLVDDLSKQEKSESKP
ncbi:hypothetical protein MGL_3844 [Malassezia globosa CBS 7966]|uniref:ATPase inhibitor, mitochondrial n=1 Tax=Malassezia globosa (strain ATCC MYA-4612 / CBS 7966) TaxID=425265 RepID=A8QAW7_MALGO|nr:uncharacterized protein MGL_3844 [Malassezia globosa CBS 7966]EDP41842.1 hypothetical protein MGL_3844 [Malassezia globosa CBS 7966]